MAETNREKAKELLLTATKEKTNWSRSLTLMAAGVYALLEVASKIDELTSFLDEKEDRDNIRRNR